MKMLKNIETIAFSTTKLVVKEKPRIIIEPDGKVQTMLFLTGGENRKGEGGLRTKGYFKTSFEDKPLITVITVVYNGEKYIEETIQSVINQTYDNVEYIIIDGGSTDGTLDIIRKYENAIDYWVSEKDRGIYDAMNKGISCATGEWVALINSGDYYALNALKTIVEIVNKNPTCKIIFGACTYIYPNSEVIHKHTPINTPYAFMSHPSTFTKKSVHDFFGLYDIRYKVFADALFFLHTSKTAEKQYTDKNLSYMREGGTSTILKLSVATELFRLYRIFGFSRTYSLIKAFICPTLKTILIFLIGKKSTFKIRKILTKDYL